MKKNLIRIGIGLVVLVIVIVAVIGLTLDKAVKHGIETVGPMVTKVSVKLDKASISLLSGAGKLEGFALGNPEGYSAPSSIQFDSASLALKPSSLLSDKIVINHIRLKAPVITLQGSLLGGNNLKDLLKNMEISKSEEKKTPETKEEKAASRKIEVDEFTLTGAKVNVDLKELGGKTQTISIPDIHLTDLGTGPEGITARELTSVMLVEVIKGTLTAVAESGGDLGKLGESLLKNTGDIGGEGVQKTVRGVMDLFKKKKKEE